MKAPGVSEEQKGLRGLSGPRSPYLGPMFFVDADMHRLDDLGGSCVHRLSTHGFEKRKRRAFARVCVRAVGVADFPRVAFIRSGSVQSPVAFHRPAAAKNVEVEKVSGRLRPSEGR